MTEFIGCEEEGHPDDESAFYVLLFHSVRWCGNMNSIHHLHLECVHALPAMWGRVRRSGLIQHTKAAPTMPKQ